MSEVPLYSGHTASSAPGPMLELLNSYSEKHISKVANP